MEHVLRQCRIALRIAELVGLDEDAPVVDLLLGAAGERRLPHRRPRAGALVRRRHRPQGDEVRARALHGCRGARPCSGMLGSGGTPLHRIRVGLDFACLRSQGDRRDARRARRAGAVAGRASSGSATTCSTALAGSYERWDGRGYPGRSRRRPRSRSPPASPSSPSSSRWRTGPTASRGARPGPAPVRFAVRSRPSSRWSSPTPRRCSRGSTRLDSWDAVIDGEPALARTCSPGRVRRGAGRHRPVRRPQVAVHARATPPRSPRWPEATAVGLGLPADGPAAGAPRRPRVAASAGSASRTRSGTRPDPLDRRRTGSGSGSTRATPSGCCSRSPALEAAGRLAGQVGRAPRRVRLPGRAHRPQRSPCPAGSLPPPPLFQTKREARPHRPALTVGRGRRGPPGRGPRRPARRRRRRRGAARRRRAGPASPGRAGRPHRPGDRGPAAAWSAASRTGRSRRRW